MKYRVLISGIISLLLAAASHAAVAVTVEDGAKTRVDAAKLSRMIDSAVRRAAPRAAVDVSVVVGPPEVWRGARRLIPGVPYAAEVLPPGDYPPSPDNRIEVFEAVRARYTIIDANGAMMESVPLAFDVGHGDTLQSRLKAMRATADYIAWRVAELTK